MASASITSSPLLLSTENHSRLLAAVLAFPYGPHRLSSSSSQRWQQRRQRRGIRSSPSPPHAGVRPLPPHCTRGPKLKDPPPYPSPATPPPLTGTSPPARHLSLLISAISVVTREDAARKTMEDFSGYPTEQPHSVFSLSTVDKEGLQRQIDELAAISDTPAPSVTRILYTEKDVLAQRYIKGLMSQAGLSVREDAVGNIFGRGNKYDEELETVATGSHIDAILCSGKYDGVVGVLGALEAFNVLKRSGFQPNRSLEVI